MKTSWNKDTIFLNAVAYRPAYNFKRVNATFVNYRHNFLNLMRKKCKMSLFDNFLSLIDNFSANYSG